VFKRIKNYMWDLRDRQRILIALTKGNAMMQSRRIDPTNPATWEFSGFSQNGEDGIIDVLRKNLLKSNRYFIEIGAADGIENNSAWLLIAEKLNGLMIEGNPFLSIRSKRIVEGYSIGAECINMFVTKESASLIRRLSFFDDPDVFSLDIDGIDYYIAQAVLEAGMRPKIFVVEYNSVFGPDKCITVEYKSDFSNSKSHPSMLKYGVSISGWRKFFESHGYKFVTVDKNGVNAFFVNPDFFDGSFLNNIQSNYFAENIYQFKKFRKKSNEQFILIADEKFQTI